MAKVEVKISMGRTLGEWMSSCKFAQVHGSEERVSVKCPVCKKTFDCRVSGDGTKIEMPGHGETENMDCPGGLTWTRSPAGGGHKEKGKWYKRIATASKTGRFAQSGPDQGQQFSDSLNALKVVSDRTKTQADVGFRDIADPHGEHTTVDAGETEAKGGQVIMQGKVFFPATLAQEYAEWGDLRGNIEFALNEDAPAALAAVTVGYELVLGAKAYAITGFEARQHGDWHLVRFAVELDGFKRQVEHDLPEWQDDEDDLRDLGV